jgi:DNA polymerase-3 subunit delta'
VPPLIGHADIVRELAALSTSDDPPHALLLAGAEGSGRTALALEYARLLNCERLHPAATAGASLFGDEVISELTQSQAGEPCGECRPCRLIAEGAHPDIITLSPGDTLCKPRDGESHARHPESRDIRICQVRGLIDLVAKYPFEARFRMVIIDPAERLYRDGQAAHTILKTLEEPPGHTVFCLVTAAPEGLLETILSRCRRIDVRPVPRAEIETGLIARGVDPGLAARAAELSKGRPGRAIGFVEHPDRMGERERLLERCARVAAEGTGERFRYANDLAERWRKDAADAAPELEAWEEFWETRLRNGSSEGGRTDELRDYLDALNAISRAREQLLAYVAVRSVFELMLLSFPRVTLSTSREETPAAYA